MIMLIQQNGVRKTFFQTKNYTFLDIEKNGFIEKFDKSLLYFDLHSRQKKEL